MSEQSPPDLEELEGREHGSRSLRGLPDRLVTGIAFCWSVFQLLVAWTWNLSADLVGRCIWPSPWP